MSQILISVVIPTYHRNDLLAKCLDCLASGAQTLQPQQYEAIVTDDGYLTTAEEMIQEHYPWVKWVAGPRKGPAANRNHGASYARGEFIAFTDDDCLPTASWLSEFKSAINPNIDVYEGKTTCKVGIRSPLEYAPVNLTGNCLWSCNMMVRATAFRELGGFDENFPYPHAEDTDLADRLKAAGCTFLFVESAIVDHPPRKLASGIQIAKTQESLVYYWRCKREYRKSFFKLKFLISILKYRLRHIFSCPLSFDYFKAISSLLIEVSYVITHVDAWDRKYLLQNQTNQKPKAS